jgi:uncharacterized protein YcfL
MLTIATSRAIRRTVVLAAAVCATAGCAHKPHGVRSDPLDYDDYPQITVLEDLHRNVVLSSVVEEEGAPLRVTVAVRNRANDDERHVQYRFFFLDSRGVPEDPNPDWHYMHMPARTMMYMQGNALDKSAVAWRLEVRPAR